MPRRTDITSILLIGSGPIVIGQACEFDYSGTQACKALKEEGYRVILLNSNPATIMTDPELADRTYLEPVTVEVVEQVIERERPDALLPTMGGQTALNIAVGLAKRGTLSKYGVELIGASAEAIQRPRTGRPSSLRWGGSGSRRLRADRPGRGRKPRGWPSESASRPLSARPSPSAAPAGTSPTTGRSLSGTWNGDSP